MSERFEAIELNFSGRGGLGIVIVIGDESFSTKGALSAANTDT